MKVSEIINQIEAAKENYNNLDAVHVVNVGHHMTVRNNSSVVEFSSRKVCYVSCSPSVIRILLAGKCSIVVSNIKLYIVL